MKTPVSMWLVPVAAILAVVVGEPQGTSAPTPKTALRAFPGAEGFGAATPGGRGGRVFEVTTLDDRGPGSLRAAVEAGGPRIVVFRVGGTLRLNSSLRVQNPFITVAGQTAPGGGITLSNAAGSGRTPLIVQTHDVVVRGLRSRPGPSRFEAGTLDALTIGNKQPGSVHDVLIDHVSLTWATDEVSNIYYDARGVTIAWSIIAEGLEKSTHPEEGEERHSMGLLIGSEGATDISVHHTLFAHNRHRNPKTKIAGLLDVVNNVVYNSGFGSGWNSPTYLHGGRGRLLANYVGNTFKPGPDTAGADWFIGTREDVELFAAGNAVPKEVVHITDGRGRLVNGRHPAAGVTTLTAGDAYARVLGEAGASFAVDCEGNLHPRRDAVDERIVSDVRHGTGRIIDDPSQVGGWPELSAGEPCADGDHDGMPDAFERRFGLNPADPADANGDADGNGYTNVEEYLNGTAPGVPPPGPRKGRSAGAGAGA